MISVPILNPEKLISINLEIFGFHDFFGFSIIYKPKNHIALFLK
jgi:hypothetical protein